MQNIASLIDISRAYSDLCDADIKAFGIRRYFFNYYSQTTVAVEFRTRSIGRLERRRRYNDHIDIDI